MRIIWKNDDRAQMINLCHVTKGGRRRQEPQTSWDEGALRTSALPTRRRWGEQTHSL